MNAKRILCRGFSALMMLSLGTLASCKSGTGTDTSTKDPSAENTADIAETTTDSVPSETFLPDTAETLQPATPITPPDTRKLSANFVNPGERTYYFNLGGSAAFSLHGCRSLINRKLIENSFLDDDSVVFEEDGLYYLPLAPFAAYHDENSEYTASTRVLTMSYNGKQYTFTGDSDVVTIDGVPESLGFGCGSTVIPSSCRTPTPWSSSVTPICTPTRI